MYKIATVVNPALQPVVGNIKTATGGAPILQTIFRNLLGIAIGAGGLWLLVQLILGGYGYITAGGDKEGLSKATSRIKNALVGIVILLSVFTIMWVVEALFGIPLLVLNIPTL